MLKILIVRNYQAHVKTSKSFLVVRHNKLQSFCLSRKFQQVAAMEARNE